MSTAHDRPFTPEPTPVLSDETSQPASSSNPATEWVGEKTILIADDAVASAYLQIVATGEWLAIDEFPAVLGRHDLATVTLNDGSVSRRHAQIVREGQSYAIEDLQSSNGIRVEGKRVGRMLLMDGDRFELGRIGLKFSTRTPDSDETVLATTQAAALPSKASEAKTMPGLGAIRSKFETRKLLPLIVAGAAVIIALAMFMNRGPRTVLLPEPESVAVEAPVTQDETTPVAEAPTPAVAEDAATAPTDVAEQSEVSETVAGQMALGTELAKTGTAPVADGVAAEPAAAEAAVADVEQNASDSAGTATASAQTASESDEPAASPEPATEVKAEPPVQAAVVAPKPAGPTRRSADFSRAYIDKSLEMYLNGDSDNAIRRLGILSRSQRNQRQFRDEALRLQQQVAGLVDNYEQGQSALDRGDRTDAASSWARFLREEGVLFGNRKSVYANRISQVVADQYIRDGDAANAEGRFHDAHRAWSKALQYEPGSVARDSLARLQTRAQELYREGYRLESVNIERAKALWREVITLLPPGTEYHTKARAKLRWHEQLGR
ncbi:MAG: FHA domain-containing protein [Gammaproteobacteria bacterium]